MELVHLAGPDLTFDGVMRQRCLWCGALIEESDYSRMATQVREGESEEQAIEAMRRTHWEGFVAVDGNVRWAVDEPEDGKAPERSCMRLSQEVTT